MAWGEFHNMVGLKAPGVKDKNKSNAEIALAKAIEMGIEGWRFNSGAKVFRRGDG
jgi:hypothetical protein